MSYSSRIDCLVEIRATFFYPGDKLRSKDVEDYIWSNLFDNTKDIVPKQPPSGTPPEDHEAFLLGEFDPDVGCDLEVTEEAVGFDIDVVSEGRLDDNYGCGTDYWISEVGYEWFTEDHKQWVESALEVRAEHEGKAKRQHEQSLKSLFDTPQDEPDLPVRRVRWLEAMGYWSSRCDYTGEYDGGVEYLGRVTLADVAAIIAERHKLEATNV